MTAAQAGYRRGHILAGAAGRRPAQGARAGHLRRGQFAQGGPVPRLAPGRHLMQRHLAGGHVTGGRHPRAGEIPQEQFAVVGANIRFLRLRMGWTQGEFGELMGWPSAATVCAAEGHRGGRQRGFTAVEVTRLGGIFGVSPQQLTTQCANCGGHPPAGFACLTCGAPAVNAPGPANRPGLTGHDDNQDRGARRRQRTCGSRPQSCLRPQPLRHGSDRPRRAAPGPPPSRQAPSALRQALPAGQAASPCMRARVLTVMAKAFAAPARAGCAASAHRRLAAMSGNPPANPGCGPGGGPLLDAGGSR